MEKWEIFEDEGVFTQEFLMFLVFYWHYLSGYEVPVIFRALKPGKMQEKILKRRPDLGRGKFRSELYKECVKLYKYVF